MRGLSFLPTSKTSHEQEAQRDDEPLNPLRSIVAISRMRDYQITASDWVSGCQSIMIPRQTLTNGVEA